MPISYGSKYFGWLVALIIMFIGGWFLLPAAYETLIMITLPQLGIWIKPILVMVNLLIVNPLTNPIAFILWIAAGFIGGVIAGTKKGGVVVGIVAWLSCLLIVVFSGFMILQSGADLGAIFNITVPPGYSLADLLGIPILQDVANYLILPMLGLTGGGGGFGFDMILQLLLPLIIFFFVPVFTVCIAAVIGAAVRPRE